MSGQSAVTPAAISPAPRRLHDADLVYLYDGSFEGFLCCVFESFLQHEIPFAIWTPERETATLYPIREIATDHARAQRVFASFGKKLGAETESLVTRDFLSGREDKELLLLRFLHLAFALGPGTVKRMGHPDVAPLYEMKKSLDWEVDQLLELAAPLELPPPSAREQEFQALWKQFYDTLEIKARHNETCRMSHCPKRFWQDMPEMQGC